MAGLMESHAVWVGRYRIEAELGHGGMGTVYRAHDVALDEICALKVTMRASDTSGRRQLIEELKLARRVTHPHVIRVFDLGEADGRLYFTMEHCAGGTLRQRMTAPWAWTEARPIVVALLEGLRAVHEGGIVHRDLKPGNILFADGGRPVLADFGIASAHAGRAGAAGTPWYAPLEQSAGAAPDARADLFALGRMTLELLAGHRPTGEQGFASLRSRVPAHVVDLLERATAFAPSDRPSSADELLRELTREGSPSRPPTRVEPPSWGADGDTDSSAPTLPHGALGPAQAPAGQAREVTRLAALPLRFRGRPDQHFLAEALTEELVDRLSQTQGLVVFAPAATRAVGSASPAEIGRALGADAVLEGSATLDGDDLRLTLRLLDWATGVQRTTIQADGRLGAGLSLGDEVAARVAEELRLQLLGRLREGELATEAITNYLEARAALAERTRTSVRDALGALEQALARAPRFGSAAAAHGVAASLRWYFDSLVSTARPSRAAAEQSVARALELAPSLPETHLGAAMFAMQDGRARDAVRSARRALQLAPTCAAALEYLGMYEVEAYRLTEGLARLRLARAIDPRLHLGRGLELRQAVLSGGLADPLAHVRGELRRIGPERPHAIALHTRLACWMGARADLELGLHEATTAGLPHLVKYAEYALGRPTDALEHLEHQANSSNARVRSMAFQLATELQAGRGELEGAARALERGASDALLDLSWLEQCPVLAALRPLPEYAVARRRVRDRLAGASLL